jgi:TatD DNase family protein
MELIDTHAHIYLEELAADLQEILERAGKEGVTGIIMPAIDSGSHGRLLETSANTSTSLSVRPDCLPMMGVHPCSINENFREELSIARALFEKQRIYAVGETGLDFYWDKTFTEKQYIAFKEQIGWALEYDIPVVIHSRQSIDECIGTVKEMQNGKLTGVFHCFSGSPEQAQQVIDLGFYLGIGGVVTFKNGGLDKVLDKISLDRVVLETDAPYLAPVPFRGKRNEPAYLRYVVDKIAAIKNIPVDEVAATTTANAKRLFGLP